MKQKKEKISAIVEKTKTGFSAYAEKYPVYTTGKSMSELIENLTEALNLYFEEEAGVSEKTIVLNIDLKQFFQFYRVLNSRFLAKRIGMNPTLLSQYVQGRKRPSQTQREKIVEGINSIGKELSEIKFKNHIA